MAISVFTFGCASVMNPYSEKFTCPQMEEGKCVSIGQAYQESVTGKPITLEEQKKEKPQSEYSPVEEVYRDALFTKLSQLLKEPRTPLLAPPKIVRVMILPYQDATGKEFYSARYVYVLVEEPQWILQNLLSLPAEEEQQ
ncbi:MAG: TraV family lipoprotein [Candidatus Bathyarchaeia archaeon]